MFALIRTDQDRERGQIAVIVAFALVAAVLMVGLVLDGGSAYAQRRSQQNAADLAAVAGANTYLLTNDATTTINAARAVAADNGWTHGTGGVTVDVTLDTASAPRVTVNVNAPHHNNFGTVIGMQTWGVGADATAQGTASPNRAVGSAPMIFSVDAFGPDGEPAAQYTNPSSPYGFGDTNNDAPETPGDFAWTNYGTGNVDTDEVRDIIEGDLIIDKTVEFGEYIGQHNTGNHSALYSDIDANMSGQDFPVPVVDHNGNFQGWATFHIVSASGGSTKKVFGYFVSPFNNSQLSVGECSSPPCSPTVYLGSYTLKLVD